MSRRCGCGARPARRTPTSTSAPCATFSASTSRPNRRPTPAPTSPSCVAKKAEACLALRIATRGSALALAQAQLVAEMLGGAELVEASSDGEPGDKSRFVRGVERVLLAGEAEIG